MLQVTTLETHFGFTQCTHTAHIMAANDVGFTRQTSHTHTHITAHRSLADIFDTLLHMRVADTHTVTHSGGVGGGGGVRERERERYRQTLLRESLRERVTTLRETL